MIGDKYSTEAPDGVVSRNGAVVEEHSMGLEGGWRLNLDSMEESMQT